MLVMTTGLNIPKDTYHGELFFDYHSDCTIMIPLSRDLCKSIELSSLRLKKLCPQVLAVADKIAISDWTKTTIDRPHVTSSTPRLSPFFASPNLTSEENYRDDIEHGTRPTVMVV